MNIVRQCLTFNGDNDRVNELLEYLEVEDDGIKREFGFGTIDLNKIVPLNGSDPKDVWGTEGNAYNSILSGNKLYFCTDERLYFNIIVVLSIIFKKVEIEYEFVDANRDVAGGFSCIAGEMSNIMVKDIKDVEWFKHYRAISSGRVSSHVMDYVRDANGYIIIKRKSKK